MLVRELVVALLVASCPSVAPDPLPQIALVPEPTWTAKLKRRRMSLTTRAFTLGDFSAPGTKRLVYLGPRATVADLCHEMRHVKYGKWHK
jgi:hypothetical protein